MQHQAQGIFTREALERSIAQNQREIKELTTKIIKSDYDRHQLEKLHQKQQEYMQKRREHQQDELTKAYLTQLQQEAIRKDKQLKETMNKQYKQAVQAKQQKQAQQRLKQQEQERMILNANHTKAIQQALKSQEQKDLYRYEVQVDKQLRDRLRNFNKQSQARAKELARQRYQSNAQLPNSKQSSFKDYYQVIGSMQGRNQVNYLSTVAPLNLQKEQEKQSLIEKGLIEAQNRSSQIQTERLNRSIQERNQLRQYLKNQIQLKQIKKSEDKLQKQLEGAEQISNLLYVQQAEQQRLKEARQERTRLMSNYDQFTPTQRRRSEPYLPPSIERKHNPVTNPINFKIDVTNPYLVREYQLAKHENTGESNLKLNKLALLGSSSLQQG